MALNPDDRARLQNIWSYVKVHAETLGGEALLRMISCDPETKEIFQNFDFNENFRDVKIFGKEIIEALTEALENLDKSDKALRKIKDLLPSNVTEDPEKFKLLNHHITITIAVYLNEKFDVVTHLSMDKFLKTLEKFLTAKDH